MPKKSQHNRSEAIKAAEFLRQKIGNSPQVAILTGTGLGDITASAQIEETVDYAGVPNFPVSTVASHPGRLVSGVLAGQPVMVLQGRFHLYEGYSPLAVTFPIRVLQALGVQIVILTNAAGGLNPAYAPGQIMVIDDHINLSGANPLAGPNDDSWGPRFPEMLEAYDRRLQTMAQQGAEQAGFSVQKGIYAGLMGPSLETPAEMRYLQTIGADAVGFSTVMETIAAVHAGMQVLGLSVITNICSPESPISVSVDEIIAVAHGTAPHLEAILVNILENLDKVAAPDAYWE